ncbi:MULTISPECIES: type II secretion system protein GspL [Pseudomonadaceae]|uniref:type II secretion system protein GspL n=1 Tax=Pseudomonadaceae TaxID=135621 RepID=UPI00042DEF6E|nr:MULTISPECIES: type II secretion system protein GspL [Pseudomonadaceae]EXF47493.1 general secretory pathway protein L [Pseudomonas sp. BAY1663]
MSLLRVALAPLDELHAETPLPFSLLDRQGNIEREGRDVLAILARKAKGRSVEMVLHPCDSLLAELEFPPLPVARLSAAVRCAIEPLILGGSQSMHIAHGPRAEAGWLTMGWVEREKLDGLSRLLIRHGLKIRGLYAAPFFLPVESSQWCACLWDGYLVVRNGIESGWVHPLPDVALERLGDLPTGCDLLWLGDAPLERPGLADSAQGAASLRWTGPAPSWGWQGGNIVPGGEARSWGKPLACCILALLVWVSGLNLHASRLEGQGKALQARMTTRVQQVFPELPVILNPLQQARQQRDLRLAGDTEMAATSFGRLVQVTAEAMPFIAGSVKELTFDDSALQLILLQDASKPPGDDWHAALAQAGLDVTDTPNGWRLQVKAGESFIASLPEEMPDE